MDQTAARERVASIDVLRRQDWSGNRRVGFLAERFERIVDEKFLDPDGVLRSQLTWGWKSFTAESFPPTDECISNPDGGGN